MRASPPVKISSRLMFVAAGKFAHQAADHALGIAKDHQSFVEVVKFVLDSGEARTHPALDHHHGARLIDLEDWHAEDRTALVVPSGLFAIVIVAELECVFVLREI